MRRRVPLILATALICNLLTHTARADCTNILVSKGAAADGSVMITYSADLGGLCSRLYFAPPADHEEGDPVYTYSWVESKLRRHDIKQVPHTYGVVGLMNEHQLAIGETTTGGRPELNNKEGLLDYEDMMILALQRAKTAREAIEVIDELSKEYGYKGPAESLSIADKNEVWLMEIIGRGEGQKGAIWVAARVPDEYISCHANLSRITTFPLDDPENWLYSPDVIDFAVKKGYYDPASGKPFSFRHAYHKMRPVGLRVCATRVWSVYRRCAPSQHFPDDYHRAEQGAEDYPLFIKPDRKLTVRDVMELMRDHFEGTPYDMTKGIDAGPFSSPYRWRDLTWEVDGETYCWERPISSQQAGFVMVTQSRAHLPDPVGGVYWYTPDDAYTSSFVPFYCGIIDVPRAYTQGDIDAFSWDSAWWVFNFVSNLTYDRYSRILPDVQEVQRETEGTYLDLQPAVERTAADLFKKDPDLARHYLTTYSVSTADRLVARWRKLGEFILTKHNDGYVRDSGEKKTKGMGYPEAWLRRVIQEKPNLFKPPKWE